MSSCIYNPKNFGAIPRGEGADFKVWAPFADRVSVVGDFNDWNATVDLLKRGEGGCWSGFVRGAKAGQCYQFEIRNGDKVLRKNDPYVREVHTEKKLGMIYQSHYQWKNPQPVLAPANELVIYELHVGTFFRKEPGAPGRFEQVQKRLPYLKHLGINAIEIMPPVEFPTELSWGYNLTNPFAVENTYGGPEALKQLIDTAHAHGLAVILDVVYNHFGPGDLDLWQFDGWHENNLGGIYFYNNWKSWTPWGDNRPDYGRAEVRQYIRDNALMWLEEFNVDGLRFDMTKYIRDCQGSDYSPETEIPEGWSLLQWLNDEIAQHFPGRLTIAEDLGKNAWLTKTVGAGGAGFGSQWDAAFVHPIRESVIVIEDGLRDMNAVAGALTYCYNDHPFERVIYSESHDEVANGKARVTTEIAPGEPHNYFAQKRSTLAAGLVFTAPGIPMIFEGQEFLEDGWFRDDVGVDWKKLQSYQGISRLYKDLIHLRRNLKGTTKGLSGTHLKMIHVHQSNKVLAFHRWQNGGPADDVVVVANFSNQTWTDYRIGLPEKGQWQVRFSSDWEGYSPQFHEQERTWDPIISVAEGRDGQPVHGVMALPPYTVLILSQNP
jgi:1,4-alpha-glucan branching enzyme